ncbi:MAG: alpha/beta hydrolase [bacterium]|nr:alpha/beta hydrolase [bacterium]
MSAKVKTQRLGSKEIFADLQKSMRRGGDTIVFIHGYNVSFDESLKAADELRRIYPGRRREKRNVAEFSCQNPESSTGPI